MDRYAGIVCIAGVYQGTWVRKKRRGEEKAVTLTGQLLEEMNLDTVNGELEKLFPEIHFDGTAVLELIMQGDIWGAIRQMEGMITDAFLTQGSEIRGIFISILILGILAALLTDFADLFQNHQVSDIAFFMVYLLFVTLLLKSYVQTLAIAKGILTDVTSFMKLFIPTYMIAVGSASGLATAGAYYQWLTVLTVLIQGGFLYIVLPAVSTYILLAVINGVWMEEKLAFLLELLEKGIGGCIKITIGTVSGFSVLQAMISPAIDSLQTVAMQKAAAAIPGIGNLTEGMLKLVVGSAVLIKNSIGIYITLTLLFICFIPIVKLVLLVGAVKLGTALISVVSDKRMTNCANRIGNGSFLLLRTALASVGIFIVQIAIIAAATNHGIG